MHGGHCTLREKFAPRAMKISYSSLESTYAIRTLTKFFYSKE